MTVATGTLKIEAEANRYSDQALLCTLPPLFKWRRYDQHLTSFRLLASELAIAASNVIDRK